MKQGVGVLSSKASTAKSDDSVSSIAIAALIVGICALVVGIANIIILNKVKSNDHHPIA